MSEESRTPPASGDRRQQDRRRSDRRTPPPPWRRPWALVAYGVLGTLVILLLVNRSRPPAGSPADAGPPDGIPAPAPELAPAQDARGAAQLEHLLAEGSGAVGRVVRAELYCSSLTQVALRSVDTIEPAVRELRDASNRVPAAECKWGSRAGEEPRGDVLLVVPPELAAGFAAAPVVDDGFVPRRQVEGLVEWLGRPESLALRNTVILRQFPIPSSV